MVKVFTMVKGEVDIVQDWVLYHGNMFGYTNLFIIDNFSLDGTYEKLLELKQKYKINVVRLPDYKKKGFYMTNFLKSLCNNEFAFPIDIDEFIVYYNTNENNISCKRQVINDYLNNIPHHMGTFKMKYIYGKNFNDNGYERAAVEITNGRIEDLGTMAKTFFRSNLFKGQIDHGNHYNTNDYMLSDLCLIHLHSRNLDQIKKKVYNNLKGLGYNPFDLNSLKLIISSNSNAEGCHHIVKQIEILEKTFRFPIESINNSDVILEPFNLMIQNLNLSVKNI